MSVVTIKPITPSSLIIRNITSQATASNLKIGLNGSEQIKDTKDVDLISSVKGTIWAKCPFPCLTYLAYIAIQSGKILEGSAESIVLTNNSYFNVAPSERVLIQFNTARKGLFGSNAPQVSGADEEQYCIFSRKQFEGCQVEIGTSQTIKFDEPDIGPEAPSELVLGGVDETFNKILEYAKTSIVKHSLRAALSVPGKKTLQVKQMSWASLLIARVSFSQNLEVYCWQDRMALERRVW